MSIDAALEFTDKTCRSDSLAGILAAEVRRLREENERQRFDILAMNQSLDLLREENERLRKDAERYRWLRDYGSTSHLVCRMFVTRYIGSATIPVYQGGALDAAIDAARGAK